jgi:hypothetical protein
VSATIVALALAGCGSSGGVKTEAPLPVAATESPTPTVTSADQTEAILAAYREFFARQTEISLAPNDQRKQLLEPFTTEPALDRVLRGMFAADGFGEVGYGQPVLHPEVRAIDGDTATVHDCQDGQKAGRMNRDTGKRVTRGAEHAKAVVTLKRGADGAWRISTVAFPDEPCDV